MRKHKQKHSVKYKVLLGIAIIVVAGLVMLILEVTNTTHLFHKTAVVRAPSTPITTLKTSPSVASNNNKAPASTPTLTQGSSTDENGNVPGGVPTNPSHWSTSTSGVITVKLPSSNSTIQSGATVTGSASVSQVQYRLTDNQVGVISEGPINVVNGTFTASVDFTTHGTSGRLDVFSTDSTGKEYNEVQIPVNF